MLHRVFSLIIKELQSLLRDPQTRLILIAPVLFQVLLFPFAATLEVNGATVAVYTKDGGPASIELIQRISHANSFSRVLRLKSPQEIQSVLEKQEALLVVRIPENFSRNLLNNNSTSLQIILDGRNSNSAQIAAGYIDKIVYDYQLTFSGKNSLGNNSQLIVRNWYNPELDYKWFVIPSLIAMVATIGVLTITALSVAREREHGNLEQLLVSPLTTLDIFIGKAVPALGIALFQATLVLIIGIFFYKVAFVGSLLLFYITIILYSFSLVGTGLLISAFCTTQQQAFVGVFIFIMPSILLSGYVSPVENMPIWLQNLTWFNPVRHFTSIVKAVYLKDADFSDIWPHFWPLLLTVFITSIPAYFIFRRRVS